MKNARRLIPVLLVSGGLAAYQNSFNGPFIFDDIYRIVDNTQIRQLWPPWTVVAHSSRPVVQLSLAINYAIGGLNVWGYHAFNLAVHVAAGLVLFGIVCRTLESGRLRTRYVRVAPWLAMAVALAWIVHPLQTESVTYIIQRAESLMGLFFLLTLYCGIRGCHSPHPRRWYVAAVVAGLLGMGSKEVMVSVPIMMLLYDWVFISTSFRDILRRRWGLYLGLGATWVIAAILLATSRVEESTGRVGVTAWGYARIQFPVIAHYVRLSLWPHPLVLDYTWRPSASLASIAPWAAAVLGLLGATVLALRRQSPVGFLGAWFFLILAPTSSILPIADVAVEHRMYLPLAAVVALVVVGGREVLQRVFCQLAAPENVRRWLAFSLIIVAVALLGYATVRRNRDYQSDVAIWRDTVAKRPDNPRAQNNLAVALFKQGRIDEAISHYSEAVRLKPDYADAHMDLALAFYHQGRFAEAITHYSEVVRLRPDHADAHMNLALAFYRQGRIAEAITHFSETVRLKPGYAEAHNNLGAALERQGRIAEAVAHFSDAVRLKPDYAEARGNLRAAQARGAQTEQRPEQVDLNAPPRR